MVPASCQRRGLPAIRARLDLLGELCANPLPVEIDRSGEVDSRVAGQIADRPGAIDLYERSFQPHFRKLQHG